MYNFLFTALAHRKKTFIPIKVVAIIVCLVLTTTMIAEAQHGTSSPYSRFGVGDLVSKGFAMNQAMGGVGLAIWTSDNLNNTNPATLGALADYNVVYEVGLTDKLTYSQTQGNEAISNDANLGYLALGFPVSKRLAFGTGLTPYSTIGYNISTASTKPNIGSVQSQFIGSGGINQFYISMAVKPIKSLSLGVTATHLFGPLEQLTYSTLREFSTSDNYYSMLGSEQKTIIRGFYFSGGIQYYQLLKKKYAISVGAVLDNGSKIGAYNTIFTTQNYIINSIGTVDTVTNVQGEKSNIEIPSNLGVGISFISPKLTIAFDYYQQDWTNASFLEKQQTNLTVSKTYKFGLQYIPDQTSYKYYKLIKYRIGAYYSDSYITINDHQLQDQGISFGFGFPVITKDPRFIYKIPYINVSFNVGRRGTTQYNLISETYANFSINLSLRDLWFMKQRIN